MALQNANQLHVRETRTPMRVRARVRASGWKSRTLPSRGFLEGAGTSRSFFGGSGGWLREPKAALAAEAGAEREERRAGLVRSCE